MAKNIIRPDVKKPKKQLTENTKKELYSKIMTEASKIVKKVINESTETVTDSINKNLSSIISSNDNITNKLRSACAEIALNMEDTIDCIKLAIKDDNEAAQKKKLNNALKHLTVYKKYLDKFTVLKK